MSVVNLDLNAIAQQIGKATREKVNEIARKEGLTDEEVQAMVDKAIAQIWIYP